MKFLNETPNLLSYKIDWKNPQTFLVPFQIQEIFDRPQPLKIEIGPGKGEFLLQKAKQESDYNFLGIEIRYLRAKKIAEAITRADISNAKMLATDAKVALNVFFSPNSVHTFFLHFPDPWPKRSHEQRRIFDIELFETIHRLLIPGGSIYLTTDVNYFEESIQKLLLTHHGFDLIYYHHGEGGDTTYHQTLHEAKFKREGRTIAYFCLTKKRSG